MKSKIYFLLALSLLWYGEISAQSSTQNYIVTTVPTAPVTDPTSLTDANSNSTIQYLDGLGRPIETVQKAISGVTSSDLVSLTEYDAFGREYRHWLPVTNAGSGAFVTPATITGNTTTLYGRDAKPYATTNFERSPLGRVTGKYGAGASWYTGKKNDSILYQTNTATEVIYFSVNTSNQLVRGNGTTNYYLANTLYKTVVTDPDGKPTTEYKDKQGQVVMTRSSTNVDTYYIYNDLGQKCYVLSPEASDKLAGIISPMTMPDSITPQTDLNTTALWQLAYHYQYDERGNCKYKKIPGCRPIYMVYDQANRLVLSQDGNQRVIVGGKNQWTVTKYDALGRVVFSGISKEISTGKTLTDLVTEYATKLITTADFSDASPLLINYYDNYDYLSIPAYVNPTYDLGYKDFSQSGFDTRYSNVVNGIDLSAKGLLTGTVTTMLDNSMNLITALYYDDRGRVVQTRANNHLSGYDYEFFHYKFNGLVLNKQHIHKAFTNDAITENYRFTYDNANRLTGEYHQLNKYPEATLATITYDELGRMNQKVLHGGIQTISYTYNIRNWLNWIGSTNFNEWLFYQDSPFGGKYYNGNISASVFGTGKDQISIHDYIYLYGYDQLNRLVSATSDDNGSSGHPAYYFKEYLSYDKNGNTNNISRYGYVNTTGHVGDKGPIDALTLKYNGNQLKSASEDVTQVTQSTVIATNDFVDKSDANYPTEYLYDANGNQTADLNKGVALIKYNSLNLPQKVQFRNYSTNEYLYDASGVKHTAKYNYSTSTALIPLGNTDPSRENTLPSTFQTDYCGNYVYEKTGTAAPVLKRILTPEGYVQTYSSTPMNYIGNWSYVYLLKDHLGNTRANLTSYYLSSNTNKTYTASGQIDYYSFGMERCLEGGTSGFSPTYNSGSIPYLFGGKEIDRMNGLNQYDFTGRWYDPTIGRWGTVDPLAELDYSVSPYAYCKNNPVNRIDPDGMADYFGNDGKYYGNDGAKNDDVRVTTQNNWNKMQTTDDKGNITYNTDYKTNQSVAFSQAQGMSEDATLDVYQHYNPTDLSLRANASENGSGGGAFWYKRDGSAKGIEINIQGNKSLGISDHSNEIKNTFVHEKQHYDDYTELGVKAYIAMSNDQKEQRAVSSSIKDETFSKMRTNIQELKKEYGAKHGLMYPISSINPLQKKIVLLPIKF